MPSASLGQYASLSFVVIGRGQEIEVRGKKKKILLWERLSRPPRLSESDGGQVAAI
jgi:hypothetical protein